MKKTNRLFTALLSALMLNLTTGASNIALCDESLPALEGTWNIPSKNYNLEGDFGDVTGALIIDGGNEHNYIDGGLHMGVTSSNRSSGYDITLRNIGSFSQSLLSAPSAGAVIKYVDGERKYFSIAHEGSANRFQGTRYGSLVYSSNGITVENSVIKGNFIAPTSMSASGGAIMNESKTAGTAISNSYITENSIVKNTGNGELRGGAVSNTGLSGSVAGDLVIKDSVITKNKLVNNGIGDKTIVTGGAVYQGAGFLNIQNTYFGDNSATTTQKEAQGGAVYSTSSQTNAQLIDSSVFEKNSVKSESSSGEGGALYIASNLASKKPVISNSLFAENTALSDNSTTYGGAIYTASKDIEINKTDFISNKAEGKGYAYGGAIYSGHGNSDSMTLNNTLIEDNKAKGSGAKGGAVFSKGKTVFDNATFKGNIAQANANNAHGGALFTYYKTDYSNTAAISNSNFINNKAEIIQGTSGTARGGAISVEVAVNASNKNDLTRQYKSLLDLSNVAFDGNSIVLHEGNTADGGAVYTGGKNFFKDVTFNNNSILSEAVNSTEANNARGGAVYVEAGSISAENAKFTNNSVQTNKGALGGAIALNRNSDYLKVVNSIFDNNMAQSTGVAGNDTVNNTSLAKGGAIYFIQSGVNKDAGYIANTDFTNNKAITSDVSNGELTAGGAIFLGNNRKLTIADSSFLNNVTYGKQINGDIVNSAKGGAIYNGEKSILNIITENKDVLFSGNKAGASKDELLPNAIYDAGGIINLNAAEGKTITFDDSITSIAQTDKIKSVLNINSDVEYAADNEYTSMAKEITKNTAPKGGTVVLNADMKGYTGEVNLNGGTLALGANGTLFDNASAFNVNAPSNISLINNKVELHHFNNLNLNASVNAAVDADLAQRTMDGFVADNFTVAEGVKINIDKINVIADSRAESAVITLAESDEAIRNLIVLQDSAKEALGRIYKYGVTQNDDGDLEFLRGDRIDGSTGDGSTSGSAPNYKHFNPSILATSVALQTAAQAGIKEAVNYAFEHNDSFTKFSRNERFAKINADKYAISEFNSQLPLYYGQTEGSGFWFRPYTVFESIDLKHGPKVDNLSYGSLIGFDSKFKERRHGWTSLTSSFIGYHGSSLDYSDVDISSNGVLLGVTKNYYKRNFWTALTASGSVGIGEISEMYGDDDIVHLSGAVSSRTGYNVEFADGRFIIQPNVSLSYYISKIFDYTNEAGVKINSDPLNSFEVKPGVRVVGNTKGGWQPYISAAFVWNFFNDTDVRADGIKLPDMRMDPYVEYGLGIQKVTNNDFTCYLQSLVRNGGRTGVTLTGGLSWAVGKKRGRIHL